MKSYLQSDEGLHYDVAIIGAGMSGLMLVRALMDDPRTAGLRILLLEKSVGGYAARTWCFWEDGSVKEPGFMKEWAGAELLFGNERRRLDLRPFRYIMIEAEEWRRAILERVAAAGHILLEEKEVLSMEERADSVWIETPERVFRVGRVFDSRWDPVVLEDYAGHTLYQQFLGWKVIFNQPVFDAAVARLMDFRVGQPGAVAFCYLLPLNARQALVEYTLFTPDIRGWEALEDSVQRYIATHFPGSLFEVEGTEQGIIPMSDYPFASPGRRITGIGTGGGCTKASTGYTFLFARRHAEAIVEALVSEAEAMTPRMPDARDLYSRRFDFYDRVMLRVISEDPPAGASILFRLFRRNGPGPVLRFLSNCSSLWEEIRIFSSLPMGLFLRAAVREWISAAKWRRSDVRRPAKSRLRRNAVREKEVA